MGLRRRIGGQRHSIIQREPKNFKRVVVVKLLLLIIYLFGWTSPEFLTALGNNPKTFSEPLFSCESVSPILYLGLQKRHAASVRCKHWKWYQLGSGKHRLSPDWSLHKRRRENRTKIPTCLTHAYVFDWCKAMLRKVDRAHNSYFTKLTLHFYDCNAKCESENWEWKVQAFGACSVKGVCSHLGDYDWTKLFLPRQYDINFVLLVGCIDEYTHTVERHS